MVRYALSRPALYDEEFQAVRDVLETGHLGTGQLVADFEVAVAELADAPFVVAVSTGTAALHLSLVVSGVGVGDEVLVPSFTYCATVQAILASGAEPVFVEVDPATGCIDLNDAARRISRRTRAMVPVYYGGCAVSADEALAFCKHYDLVLVEDAAHAFGSDAPSGRIGSGPGFTCFSFGPIKPFTCGQGGAIAVGDAVAAAALRSVSDLGMDRTSGSVVVRDPGFRYRMLDLHAGLGLQQLRRFEEFRAQRRTLWSRYHRHLQSEPDLEVLNHDPTTMLPFLFAVRVDRNKRDRLRQALACTGVETGVHYEANHLQPAFCGPGRSMPLPVTEQMSAEVLTVPFHHGLTTDDVDDICDLLVSTLGDLR